MISNIEYNQDTHELSITFNTDAGDVTIDNIDLSDLVDIYEEGNGIEFIDGEQGKKVNIQIDPDSEEFISVSASGLKISGIISELEKKANVEDIPEPLIPISIDYIDDKFSTSPVELWIIGYGGVDYLIENCIFDVCGVRVSLTSLSKPMFIKQYDFLREAREAKTELEALVATRHNGMSIKLEIR